MEIEILEYSPDTKGARVGYVDFKITYTPEKHEIFRQVAFFEKEDRKWLSTSAVERNGQWLQRYERVPSMKNTFHEVIEALEAYIKQRTAF